MTADLIEVGAGDRNCVNDGFGSNAVDSTDPDDNVAEADRKWTVNDCTHGWTVIVEDAPTPTCSTSRTVLFVIVQASPDSARHESVQNDVDNCELYLVAYDVDAGYTWISTTLSYQQCCEDLELGAASSFLKWVKWPRVDIGPNGPYYEIEMRNAQTIIDQGDEC